MDDQDQAKAGSNQQTSAILGSVQKEQGPSVLVSEQTPLTATEKTPVLHPEVKEAGVEVVSQPVLTAEDQKAGLSLAKESVPPITEPSGIVQLEYLKNAGGGSSNSVFWLYKLMEKITKVKK